MTKTRAVTDHYRTLGVSPDASPDEIRDVFTSLIRQYRERPGEPDRARVERAREIKMAYATLNDPQRRRAHDEELGIVRERRRGAGSPFLASPLPMAAAPAAAAASIPHRGEPQPDRVVAREPEPNAVEEPPHYVEPAPVQPESAPQPLFDEPPAPAYHQDNGPFDERDHDHAPRSRKGAWIAAAGALLLAGTAGTVALMTSDDPAEQEAATSPQAEIASRGDAAAPAATGTAAPGVEPIPDELPQPGGFSPFEAAPAAADGADTDVPLPAELEAADRASAPAEAAAEEAPAAADEEPATPPPAQVRPRPAEPPVQVATAPPPRQPSRAARARYVSGGLSDTDNPGGRFVGAVGVRLTVGPNGRVTNCRAERSSGNPELDARTCRLAQQRITFDPARNDEGTPVQTEVTTTYTWGRRPRQ